ncbi:putative serine protein kinase PrkA [Hydrogenispora ethanolica]|uniref:Putative serine protein kinase PrkA n=1 Tax=Hydrogenispora ethanolica TaxID=1082276 RepID=A0A4R1RY16_HYDET|nr:PrkA family serine protein kinase [Hydrogenispora ethanolica]TCL70872.1 putative serine protein kinase PrkA [Hydrogenispora ethanolica]
MESNEISELIKKDRSERKQQYFEGTFLDYLDLVKQNPEIAQLAHQRIYQLITERGVDVVKTEEHPRLRRIYGNDIIKRYRFFSGDFYGIDRTIMKIARYFHAAAMQGEESRQVLYLVGPVGAGKSSIMEHLKRALEAAPPIYAIKDCPMREEPLHLIPKHLREEFSKLLKVHIEGDLCPVCRYRLRHEFHGEYERMPVVTVEFSIRSRKGVGVVPPVDPNNQDTSVLIGSVDISKMDLYPEDDPRVLSLNGAFNVANRGIAEFIEVFKNEIEYLHTMITATQEKSIPSPGKGAMIYFDGVILAHSNEAEWNKFKADHTNEAILDRIVKVEVPYCLELAEEIKIYQKLLRNSNFTAHIAPHTIELASMFAILTRLAPSAKVDPMTKLKIYNGEEILEQGSIKKVDIAELREEATNREGMTGISTRFIMKALDTALAESESNCINPLAILGTLTKAVKELALPEEERKRYLGFLQDNLKKEFHKLLEGEVTKAFIHGYQEQARDLFNNYLDHAEAYANRTKLKDKNTGEELEPDEKFLSSIEEQIGITGSAAKGFRQDVTAYMFFVLRNGGTMDYNSYEPLKAAIEKKLTASVKELSRVITQAKVRDKEQSEKYHTMVEEMKRNGYCDHCCNVILKYAANHLWKD